MNSESTENSAEKKHNDAFNAEIEELKMRIIALEKDNLYCRHDRDQTHAEILDNEKRLSSLEARGARFEGAVSATLFGASVLGSTILVAAGWFARDLIAALKRGLQ